MDGVIKVRVNGYSIVKDHNCAGAQYASKSTKLRIEFGEDWDKFTKTVTFWNALGQNPTKIDCYPHMVAGNNNVYLVPVPGEVTDHEGMITFVIDGYDDDDKSVIKRSVEDTLKILPSRKADNAINASDPTPDQMTQLQNEIENIKGDILSARGAKESAGKAAESAVIANDAALRAESAAGKTSYIGDNGNWYEWSVDKFVDTGVRAQAGSEVYVGKEPPESADVWINPDGQTTSFLTAEDVIDYTGLSSNTVDVTIPNVYSERFFTATKEEGQTSIYIPLEKNDTAIKVTSTPSHIAWFQIVATDGYNVVAGDLSSYYKFDNITGATGVEIFLNEAGSGTVESVIKTIGKGISAEVKDGSITQRHVDDSIITKWDFASTSDPGIVRVGGGLEITDDLYGVLSINPADEESVRTKSGLKKPITPGLSDYAIAVGTHQEMSDTYDPAKFKTCYYLEGKQGQLPVSYNAVKNYVDKYVDKSVQYEGLSTDTVNVTVSQDYYSERIFTTTKEEGQASINIPLEEKDSRINVSVTPYLPVHNCFVRHDGGETACNWSDDDLTRFEGATEIVIKFNPAVINAIATVEATITSFNNNAISAEVKDGSITKQKLADKLVEELETHVIGEIVGDTSAQPAQASNDWATTNFDFTDNFDASQDGIYTGEGITYDANGINFPSDAFRAWRYRPASKHNGWSPLCISYNYAFGFKLDSGGILEQTAPMIWNNHRVYLSITETGVTVFNGGATNGASIAVTENENDFVPGNSWNDVLVVANGDTDGYHVYMKKKTDATFTHVAYAPTYRQGGSWADTGFLLEAKGAKVSYAVSCKAVSQPSNEEVFPVSLMNAAGRVLAPYILKNVWKELLDRYYIWF